jgi:hypothetical protein
VNGRLRHAARAAALLLVAPGLCAPVYAQARSGGGATAPAFNVLASASASADTESSGGAASPITQSAALAATVDYRRDGRVMGIQFAGGGNGKYDQALRTFTNVDVTGSANWSLKLGRRLGFTLREGVTRSTTRFQRLLPVALETEGIGPGVAIALPATPHQTDERPLLTYASGAGLTYAVARGTSIEADAALTTTADAAQPGADAFQTRAVRLTVRQSVTRYANLRLGYGYRIGEYGIVGDGGNGGDAAVHDIDLGLEYSKPLSLTRRTALSFGSGSSVIGRQGDDGTTGEPRQLRLNGDATLTHEIGRTWQARMSYRRGISFVEGFAAPVGSDGATALLSGRLARRVVAGFQAAASTGLIGQQRFTTYTGGVALRIVVSGAIGIQGGYSYMSYRGVPPARSDVSAGQLALDRHGAQIGLTFAMGAGK